MLSGASRRPNQRLALALALPLNPTPTLTLTLTLTRCVSPPEPEVGSLLTTALEFALGGLERAEAEAPSLTSTLTLTLTLPLALTLTLTLTRGAPYLCSLRARRYRNTSTSQARHG